MHRQWVVAIVRSLRSFAWLIAFGLAASAPVFAAPTLVDFGFDSIYEDNISRTPDAMGTGLNGLTTRAFASARKGFILTEDLSFMMKVGVGYKKQHIAESADYVSGNLVLASNYRPFTHFAAPVFKASLDVRAKRYLNAFSDEQLYRVKLSAHSQLTDVIRAQVGVARRLGESEWASVDTIDLGYWDTDRTEYFVGLDVDFESATLYTKLSQAEGELIWTRQTAGGYQGNLWDNAKIRSLQLGLNYPISDGAALDLLARYTDVDRNGNDMYELSSVSMAYIKRISF